MRLGEIIKKLGEGIHPETGEPLDSQSIARNPEAIRVLTALAEELQAGGDANSKFLRWTGMIGD